MTREIRIGLVGTGFLAETRRRCFESLRGRARIAAVCARDPAKARSFASRCGAEAVLDLDALLALPDLDAVDLCVPNHLHRDFTERAARAGKAVICTKPLTAYVGQDQPADVDLAGVDRRHMLAVAIADCERMIRACASAGRPLFYAENWLFAPAFRRAQDLLLRSGGSALELRGHEAHSGSHAAASRSWRTAGGGALLRLGAHPVAAMLALKEAEGLARRGCGIRPVEVTADVADLTRNELLPHEGTAVATGWQDVENWGLVSIRFDDGSRGIASGADVLLGGMESQLEIRASNCRLKVELSPTRSLEAFAPDETVFGEAYVMEKAGTSAGWSRFATAEDHDSGHLAMIESFVECLAKGLPSPANGELGREVLRVIYSAYVSASEGRRVSL